MKASAPGGAAGGGAGASTLILRVLPLQLYAGRSWVVLERNLRVYRRSWMIIVSGFFEPVFFLFALGQGLGALVGTVDAGAGPVSYAAYIAPGLLATSAMNGAIYDSTVNVYFKMRYAKLYDAMLATALGSDGCRARRDRLVAAARRNLRRRVCAGDAGDGAAGVLVGAAGGAGGAADRARVRCGRDGVDVLREVLAAAGVDQHGDPADVPVLHHLLSAGRLPPRRSRRSCGACRCIRGSS
jgi:hypothetical protein